MDVRKYLVAGVKPADGKVTGQPFDTGVSANYRIPGLVWHKGCLAASADVRWDPDLTERGFSLAETVDFPGKSHEAITREVYVK